MKINRAHYSSWKDPAGGEWIKMIAGRFEGTIWRPVEMNLDENNQVKFQCEFLNNPVDDYMFNKVATAIISDQLTQIAAEDTSLVEAFPQDNNE